MFALPTIATIYEQPPTNAPMTNLPIHITTHHLSASNALHRFAREKINSVCRFANDVLAADVVLRRHGGAKERFSASARLALPGRDIHGRAVASNLYTAIGKLVTKLARLSRKRKTRLAKTFEHPGRSETASELTVSLHAQKILPEPPDAPGQAHAREGGQEIRVFPFRRQSPFASSPIPIGRGIRS
jgi:putative sigma-54 modulation protein